jgi:uncharacterized protein
MEGTTKKLEDTEVSADLKTVVAAARAALAAHVSTIDALNVYPVPDGDTGTNMLLTLRSVLEEISASPHLKREEAAKVVSRAALMGARGNSGVILSQILRGACETLGKARILDAEAFVAALDCAKERAYEAVQKPVEGTMLSVVKDAAAAASLCVEQGEKDRLEVLRAAAREAHASVKRTPELLGVLKDAGVVDAGGLGVAVILDGISATLGGEEPRSSLEVEETEADEERLRETVVHSAEEAWGYCTEFIINDFSGEGEFETRIQEMGKSVLVIPDDDLVKVHLHTQDPGSALTYASGFGRLSGVKIDDMEAQTRVRAGSDTPATSPIQTAARLGLVVASRGAGNHKLFEAMGAVVVEGGQSANPSAEDFVQAVKSSGASAVVLLPNNENVVPTAEAVKELVEADIHVVPTTNIACGLATMIAYDAEGKPAEVAEEMREICEEIWCAEVTIAVRDARVEGREVRKGACMGFLGGKLQAVEASVHAAALDLAETIVEEGADIVMLLRGKKLREEAAEKIAEDVRRLAAGLVVEVKDGGQPLYPLQMVAE